jgi:hypothetical protein
MSDVFLSYTRVDNDLMQRVKGKLTAGGIKVWTDESLIPGTKDWEDDIEKAIWGAHAFVVVMTPDAKRSQWVNNEISFADQAGVTIFPLLGRGKLKHVTTLRLVNRQWVILDSNFDREMDRLVRAILSIFDLTSLPRKTKRAIKLARQAIGQYYAGEITQARQTAQGALTADPGHAIPRRAYDMVHS